MDRELLLLGLLRQQAMHGYQLMEFIDRALSFCTDLKKPTAYFLLEKMAAAGWVAQTKSQAGHRPPRRVYRLTAEGEAQFQRLLRANLAAYTPVTFPGDIGLAFLETLAPAEAAPLLAARRAALVAALAEVQAAPPHAGSPQLLIEHRRRHLAAELEWLDEVVAHLPSLAPSSPPAKKARPRAAKVPGSVRPKPPVAAR